MLKIFPLDLSLKFRYDFQSYYVIMFVDIYDGLFSVNNLKGFRFGIFSQRNFN